jgi:DNA-binding NarL/FixJ family response regulator
LAIAPPAPKRIPHRTPLERERAVLSLRALRLTGEQIAAALGLAPSTVSLVAQAQRPGAAAAAVGE